ncbi:dermonecrotic toxin domain-containing protein [Pseudomonas alabamensis]|uniref:dermonecrotic toxin domain-containing protein n=1 Tax=Pseudomonas alabamensis TaxID=3064349 RepID=UPI000745C661|nr:hypothetical protein APT63_06300 [Pseudomonas monteilii]
MGSTSHLALIEQRVPTWLQSATPAQRHRLRERIIASHRATRAVATALRSLQDIDAFCRPLLQEALARWFPAATLPAVDIGRVWHHERKYASSWLETALQNVEADARLTLYASAQTSEPLTLDTRRFVLGLRNLDLGQRYKDHLTGIVDNDAFRALLRQQDHTAFAAEVALATLQQRLDEPATALAEALLAGASSVPQADGTQRALCCNRLTLAGISLRGPLLISLEPKGSVEPCLLYLPGHPRLQLRQYASLQAAAKALTRLMWQPQEREFFSRYVLHVERARFAERLQATLYPYYPFDQVYAHPPVLEPGQRIGWMKRLFPAPTAVYQATLDKNARLPMHLTPWPRDCFEARARTQVEGMILDATRIAVPVAQRDADAQWALIERWLGIGLTVLNLAALLVPGLGETMLVVGGAQLVDEFLEGIEAANDRDVDAALSHLFDVFENLAQMAALGAAATYVEPLGVLHDWIPIGEASSARLWHGSLEPFTRPGGWPRQAPALSQMPVQWQGRQWIDLDGHPCAIKPAPDGSWRLIPLNGRGHQPALRQHLEGYWLLQHERPLGWDATRLLNRVAPSPADLTTSARLNALRCSGYSVESLRQAVVDHQPLPALLLDSLEAFGARLPAPLPRAEEGPLARVFPGLTRRARHDLLAQATPADVVRLQGTQRVPLAMAEAARLYLREGRLNRALRDFHLAAVSSDRDTLIIAALQRLPGWRATVHLRVMQGEQVVAATAPSSGPTKTLLRLDTQYQPLDEQGNALSSPTTVFQALLCALPDSEREALALQIHDTEALRDQLFDQVALDRERSALDLGMAQVRPWYRLPGRWPGTQGIGYALSGRGAHNWQTGDELFDQVFPPAPGLDRSVLRTLLRWEAGPQAGAFAQLMLRLQGEYQRLDEALQTWVSDEAGVTPERQPEQRAARDSVAQHIRRAWRRESPSHGAGSLQHIELHINARYVDTLPILPDPLPSVRSLELNGLSDATTARLNDFLHAFPQLRVLDLSDNSLTLLPARLGELHNLESLNLAENNLTLDDEHNLSIILRLQALRNLGLTDALSDLSFTTLQRLGQLPALRVLLADVNELAFGPAHFQALQQWPALEELHLGQNQITLDPPTRQALAGLNRLIRLSLYENPLDLPPDLTGWTRLRQLDLEHTGIVDWPPGLLGLLDQRPLVLRALDLGHNGLTDVPPLAHTAFAEAIRAHDPDVFVSLGPNPWSEQAQILLNDAGLEAQTEAPAFGDWHADWPEPLREHVAHTLTDAHWQPLYGLFDRVSHTGDYQHNPAALRTRMAHVVQVLSTDAQADATPAWGLAQLHQEINERLHDAGQACVDQASLLFQDIETEVTTWEVVRHAQPGASHEQTAIDSAGALYRQRLLEEQVGALYQARLNRRRALADATDAAGREAAPPLHPLDDLDDAALSEPNYLLDELEMALYARLQLREPLRLPPQPAEMSFGYLARLSHPTLQRLANTVRELASGERVAEWAATQRFWQAWLRRLYPQQFVAFSQRWEGASAYFDQLSEAGAGTGRYEGPPVPEPYIAALEQAFPAVPGLTWRQAGVVQSVNLVSGRIPQESAIYQRAAQLLLETRVADETMLYRTLSQTLGQLYTP